MEPLIKILEELRAISPRADFHSHSKSAILSASQKQRTAIWARLMSASQYTGALVFASLLMFAVLGGFSLIKNSFFSPAILSSLDADKLNQEIRGLDSKIRLSEIKYYEDSINTVSVALNEASHNGPGHLNSSLIQQEANSVNTTETSNKNIEELLNELVL